MFFILFQSFLKTIKAYKDVNKERKANQYIKTNNNKVLIL
jgi:hypothetical protein